MVDFVHVVNKKTDYIFVEMILNKENKYDIISGLFKGILTKEKDVFILLSGIEGATNFLSTNFYNILSIEELSDDFKNFTFLSSTKDDQETALEILESLYYKLINNGYALKDDPKIIDIEKYENVEPDLDKKTYGKPEENNSFNTAVAGNSRTVYKSNNIFTTIKPQTTTTNVNNSQTQIKPLVMVRNIKEDPIPSEEALNSFKEKLDKLKNNDYIVPIPIKEVDEDEEVIEIEFDMEEEDDQVEENLSNSVGAARVDPKSLELFDKEDMQNMGIIDMQHMFT